MISRFPAVVALALGVGSLAGCEVFKKSEETVGTVSSRITGMPAGDFFDRYGRPKTRTEVADGGAVYDWESALGYTRPGFPGADDKTCRLRVTADRRGRITGAVVILDAQGLTGTSRCREIFAAP